MYAKLGRSPELFNVYLTVVLNVYNTGRRWILPYLGLYKGQLI